MVGEIVRRTGSCHNAVHGKHAVREQLQKVLGRYLVQIKSEQVTIMRFLARLYKE
jgi:hypothetical protein